MKKRVIAVLLILVLALSFASCGSKDKLEGTWDVVKLQGMDVDGWGYKMTFKNGKCILWEEGDEMDDDDWVSYTATKDTITLKSDGETATLKYSIVDQSKKQIAIDVEY